MEKKFIQTPTDAKERHFFFIELSTAISGNVVKKDELIRGFNLSGIEFNDELKAEIKDRFPEIDLD